MIKVNVMNLTSGYTKRMSNQIECKKRCHLMLGREEKIVQIFFVGWPVLWCVDQHVVVGFCLYSVVKPVQIQKHCWIGRWVLVDVLVVTYICSFFFLLYLLRLLNSIGQFGRDEDRIEFSYHNTSIVNFYNPFEHCRLYKWFHEVFSSFVRTHTRACTIISLFGIITSHFREYACAAHECVCQLNFTNKQMNQNTFSIYRIHTFKTKNFVVILSFLRLLIATLYYDVSCAHKKIHTYSKHFSPCVDSVQIDVVVVMALVLVVDQRFETCFPLAICLYL